jgi:hypothetical protein
MYSLAETNIIFTNNMRWVYGQNAAQGAGNGQESVNGRIQGTILPRAGNRLGENHKTTSLGVGLARSRRI